MANFVVDEWGNCWSPTDPAQTTPVLPHPELTPEQARCPACGKYVYRDQAAQGFTWRCACGREYPDLHH